MLVRLQKLKKGTAVPGAKIHQHVKVPPLQFFPPHRHGSRASWRPTFDILWPSKLRSSQPKGSGYMMLHGNEHSKRKLRQSKFVVQGSQHVSTLDSPFSLVCALRALQLHMDREATKDITAAKVICLLRTPCCRTAMDLHFISVPHPTLLIRFLFTWKLPPIILYIYI